VKDEQVTTTTKFVLIAGKQDIQLIHVTSSVGFPLILSGKGETMVMLQ